MGVGLLVTKSEIDSRSGDLARSFQRDFNQVETLKSYLDSKTEADLVALGYTVGEVTILKTAINDLNQLMTIWNGNVTLVVAKDFRTFVRQLWGVGAF